MATVERGSLRLFRVFGIDVFLHWSWALVAAIELQIRNTAYHSQIWNVLEYLTLFAIVLLHEFGHSLACRSVGGKADRIMLWPLGGIAYVSPPPRAGALLWSIAAGPLVNVVLAPIVLAAYFFLGTAEAGASRDLHHYLYTIAAIDIGLLIFNLLPIYPLDGGQIVRALLWFFVGQNRSLTIAATIGLVGAVAGMVAAVSIKDTWLVILAAFAAIQSWKGLQAARSMATAQSIPRHVGIRCPACYEPPPVGQYWRCSCGAAFDTFLQQRTCPHCGLLFDQTACPFCGESRPFASWFDTTRSSPPAP